MTWRARLMDGFWAEWTCWLFCDVSTSRFKSFQEIKYTACVYHLKEYHSNEQEWLTPVLTTCEWNVQQVFFSTFVILTDGVKKLTKALVELRGLLSVYSYHESQLSSLTFSSLLCVEGKGPSLGARLLKTSVVSILMRLVFRACLYEVQAREI